MSLGPISMRSAKQSWPFAFFRGSRLALFCTPFSSYLKAAAAAAAAGERSAGSCLGPPFVYFTGLSCKRRKLKVKSPGEPPMLRRWRWRWTRIDTVVKEPKSKSERGEYCRPMVGGTQWSMPSPIPSFLRSPFPLYVRMEHAIITASYDRQRGNANALR